MKKFFYLLFAAVMLALPSVTVSAVSETDISVSARSAVLIEASGKNIIYEKNANVRLPMASTTKIMTSLVVLENRNLDDIVEVSQVAVGTEGSSVYLQANEKLTVSDLLYAMMLESANDAAAALAIEVGGSIESFAEMMNEKARDIGCTNTHFANPHGLDNEEHYTTALELALITAEAMKNEDFKKIVSTVQHTIPQNGGGVRILINHNRLLREKNIGDGGYIIGVKTGFTKKCGRCLVSAAERDGVTVIAVTLSAPDDWNDHRLMLSLGLDSYENRILAEEGALSYAVPVTGGNENFVTAVNDSSVSVILPKNASTLSRTVSLEHFLFAPVEKGELLGEVVWTDENGNTIAKTDLIADSGVQKLKKKTLKSKLAEIFRR